MLRKDQNAAFEKHGALIFSRYRFVASGVEARRSLSRAEYGRLRRRQTETPVCVLVDEERRRAWWLFNDSVYFEDDGYDAEEVKALLLAREAQKQRRLKRALAMLQQTEMPPTPAREAIAGEVKRFVWRRDGGRCVGCGGQERLEFDHVIPLAMGGSNTARNLQILCEACNREKGASLV